MKRTVMTAVFLSCLLILTGCFLFNDFDQSTSLAENALKNGSASSALNYAEEAFIAARDNGEKSKAMMLKGYAYYLLGQYANASTAFDGSLNYSSNNDSISGKILSLFMLNSNSLVLEYIEEISLLPDSWSLEINNISIDKTSLYRTAALSAKLVKNQQKFNEIQIYLNQSLAAKMEAFFDE
ncbi:MAG TPA: tetratricopeptide repeat protein [Thermotogota bacterium]|nr:tetratricopeptide repeat protein [Thermotogota bacterium]HPJ87484.1 tetratricopeptide repeat protein [Thermotogota bacterium]HPR94689.1 tetratricopeptide repeat protein [Thermotogota bacterium]